MRPDTRDRTHTLHQLTALGPTLRSSGTIRPGSHEAPVTLPLAGEQTLELGGTLGEGGMGVVREGRQTALRRAVAVKTPRSGVDSPRACEHLVREALVAATVEHPNVVPVYELRAGPQAEPLLVMRRIEGTEWTHLLRDGAAVEARFHEPLLEWNLGVLQQIARAAHFAHTRGVVHRDIKPANVMVGAFGEVYLVDWGIAVRTGNEAPVRELAGTPAYMAPEMLGWGDITPRTDVYLLGAVLYELFTGRPPHRASSPAELITAVGQPELTFPPEVPPEGVAIVRRAMATAPEERFASAEEFQLAVARFVRHQGSVRLARQALARLEALRTQTSPSPTPTDQPVHETFGAVRFGLLQALHEWPDNAEAREGLAEAARLMCEHELAHGRPHAAAWVLREVPQAPPPLVARVQAAQDAFEREARRAQRLSRDFDPHTNVRPRQNIAVALGLVVTVLPAARELLGVPLSLATEATGAAGLLAFTLLLGWLMRHTLLRTKLNRRFIGLTAFVYVAELLLLGLSVPLGIPLASVQVLLMLLWCMTVSSFAIAIDHRMWWSVPVLAACLATAAYFPAWTNWLMSAGLLVVSLNMVFMREPGEDSAAAPRPPAP